jgi:hypothetical protein
LYMFFTQGLPSQTNDLLSGFMFYQPTHNFHGTDYVYKAEDKHST